MQGRKPEGDEKPEEGIEGRMSLTGHLGELRRRIVVILVGVGVGFGGAFYFSEPMVEALTRPVKTTLIFTSPTEALWSHFKVALLSGLLLSLPVTLFQIYRFISPGLYPGERRKVIPFVLFGTLAFLLGLSFCYFVVLPFGIGFLLTYKTGSLIPMISVGSYVDFVVKFLLAFGLIFELPVAIVFLSRLGLLTPAFLSRNRKYAVLIIFIASAILTPTPDVFNQLLMAVPLLVLYEIGILGAKIFGTR